MKFVFVIYQVFQSILKYSLSQILIYTIVVIRRPKGSCAYDM